ncbi:hypothetical protein F4X86_02445 [Candidatus Saccharibacteria bacterium]|nr:hypothetical protein [Candidatus Saccharibacteria bacterium]
MVVKRSSSAIRSYNYNGSWQFRDPAQTFLHLSTGSGKIVAGVESLEAGAGILDMALAGTGIFICDYD